MYRLRHANLVPVRAGALRLGLPIYEHTIPNIAIISANNMDPIHLNATILRAALLNSPKEVEELLGLKVVDLVTTPVPEKPITEPKKKVSKETKEVKTSKESKEEEEWV